MNEELAAFRDRLPGCSVVAFADLSTGMVLASSTAEKTTQERLDALCQKARHALKGAVAQSMSKVFGDGDPSAPSVALRADAESLACFVHAPAPAQEALCCIIGPQTPVSTLIENAVALLERTAAEG